MKLEGLSNYMIMNYKVELMFLQEDFWQFVEPRWITSSTSTATSTSATSVTTSFAGSITYAHPNSGGVDLASIMVEQVAATTIQRDKIKVDYYIIVWHSIIPHNANLPNDPIVLCIQFKC